MVVSIEDIPVATETECEKSNGAADQTTTQCDVALEKRDESLTTAATTATVDDILNGIKPPRYAAAEEKKAIEENEEQRQRQELTKIEPKASSAKEGAIDGVNETIDEPERSNTPSAQNEQSETPPLRNGLAHENAEENGVSVGEEDDAALEKMMDEVSAVVEKQSDQDAEKLTAETPSAEESVSAASVEAMEVDEGASQEPMETTNPADEGSAAESKPAENGAGDQTVCRDDEDSPKEDAESSETTSCTKEAVEESVELEKKDELSQPSADDNSPPALKEPSSAPEKTTSAKDTPAPMSAVDAPAEREDSNTAPPSPGAFTDDDERLPVKPTAASSEPICDSEGTASVQTKEKSEKPASDDKDDKNIVEQIPEVDGEIHIKEEVMSTEGSSFNEGSNADPAEPATTTASVSLSDGSAQDSVTPATASMPATTQATGTKRRADTASEELEADRGSSSSGSDMETNQDPKRIRFDESIFEEDERDRLIREFVERSTESSDEIGKNCDKLQHEIGALSDLARAKELEWNSIIRLLKLKEEMLERVLFKKRGLECQSKTDTDSTSSSKLYKSITSSTEQTRVNRNELNVPTCIGNQVTVVPISSLSAASAGSGSQASTAPTGQDSMALKSAAAAHLSSSLRAQHRPILPKPAPGIVNAGAGAGANPTALTTTSVTQSAPSAIATVQPTTHVMPLSAQTLPQNLLPANAANSLLIDQNSVIGEGRQGPILDVKSIIAEYRSKNPESSPRRGRRNIPFTPRIPDTVGGPRFLPNTALLSMANMALGSGSQVRTNVSSTTHSSDHGRTGNMYLAQEAAISAAALNRPDLQIRQANVLDPFMLSINAANSSNSSQSTAGNSSAASMASGASTSNNAGSSAPGNNSSFQDALVKFAKMNEKRSDMVASSNAMMSAQKNASHLLPPPPYPEVTLHPVLVPQYNNSPQNSLLHGILTKSSSGPSRGGAGAGSASGSNLNSGMGGASGDHHPSSSISGVNVSSASNLQHRPTTFSPTLARLLTAPDRNRSSRANASNAASRNTKLVLNEIIHSKKNRTEVTITPVTTNATPVMKNGSDVLMVDDDDESENTDRLVIDEGREAVADPTTNVIPADQVPQCQGCHKKSAQFVCAGCGNQWYCSRECQVDAWEEHSERCTG